MIGQLRFHIGSQPYTATLTTAFEWQCDDNDARELLDCISPTDIAQSSDDPTIGRHLLFRASARLGGEVLLEHSEQRACLTAI